MFPEPTELFDRINLDHNIQIKYIDTKNQLADILTKGHFTRDEWNHLLCLFNICHFSSTNCSEVMSKRTQEEAGEERVTAKSKPMMNLVSRCRVRDPTVLASTASERPGKTKSESQNVPLSSLNVQQTSTERPVLGASSSFYSEWNIDDKWSSQVWKSGEMSNTSTVRPVYDKFVIDDDMDSDTAAELNLSLKSRSFLKRVNDRLRKMLNRSPKDSLKDIDKRSMIWWMFMSSTLEASVFVGKIYSDNLHSIKNTGKNLTVKQMFVISEKLISEQSDDFWSVSNQQGQFSLEEVISLSHAKVYVFFSDSVLCLGKVNQNPTSNTAWIGSKIHHNTEFWTQLTENRWNSSVLFSQDSPHCSSSKKSKSSWTKWATQNNSKDELSSCRCSMTSYGEIKTMKRNVLLMPHLCLYLHKDFQQDVGHSSDLENGTVSLNWWWSNSEKADTQFSEPRVRCLEERSKAKEVVNYLYTSVPMEIRLKLFFAQSFLSISSVSTEQFQICVKNTVIVKQEQGDVLWQKNLIHFSHQQTYWYDTHTLDWNSCTRKSIAEAQRTSGKASTTRSIDKSLYWCRIPENSWSRTVFHDERHFGIFTISCSGLSWIHSSKRRRTIWTKRLDSS